MKPEIHPAGNTEFSSATPLDPSSHHDELHDPNNADQHIRSLWISVPVNNEQRMD